MIMCFWQEQYSTDIVFFLIYRTGRCMLSTYPITDNSSLNCSVKVVAVRLHHCTVNIFSFVINTNVIDSF